MDSFSEHNIACDENAEFLKALAHPVRLCIVQGLLNCKGCNVSKIQKRLNIPQSTISQHLATLRHSNIIAGERKGLEIIYRVIHPKAQALVDVLFDK